MNTETFQKQLTFISLGLRYFAIKVRRNCPTGAVIRVSLQPKTENQEILHKWDTRSPHMAKN